MNYGLVGNNLIHSYSKKIHDSFGLYKYELFSLSEKEFRNFLMKKSFKGVNVTIPYKKFAIPFCDVISDLVSNIGSLNTLVERNGHIEGYNTDYAGLYYAVKKASISLENKRVLILGTGGTALTAKTLSENLKAKETIIVSRSGSVNYNNIYKISDADIIINTTPVGTFPDNGKSLLNLDKFYNLSGVIDVVYNPLRTKLLLDAEDKGIPTASGLDMLAAQAKLSSGIFTGEFQGDDIENLNYSGIGQIIDELKKDIENIVLIGMPGSGKSTLGDMIAKKLNRNFIDIDSEIVKKFGISINDFFEKYGEEKFREVETELLFQFGRMHSLVISTGGGAILRKENFANIKQNSKVYWIKRSINNLDMKGRPLSKDANTLKEMLLLRKPLYLHFSDREIINDSSPEEAVSEILRDFYSF